MLLISLQNPFHRNSLSALRRLLESVVPSPFFISSFTFILSLSFSLPLTVLRPGHRPVTGVQFFFSFSLFLFNFNTRKLDSTRPVHSATCLKVSRQLDRQAKKKRVLDSGQREKGRGQEESPLSFHTFSSCLRTFSDRSPLRAPVTCRCESER